MDTHTYWFVFLLFALLCQVAEGCSYYYGTWHCFYGYWYFWFGMFWLVFFIVMGICICIRHKNKGRIHSTRAATTTVTVAPQQPPAYTVPSQPPPPYRGPSAMPSNYPMGDQPYPPPGPSGPFQSQPAYPPTGPGGYMPPPYNPGPKY